MSDEQVMMIVEAIDQCAMALGFIGGVMLVTGLTIWSAIKRLDK